MLNLTLLNILRVITAVNDILYTGSDYYIIITEIPVNYLKNLLHIKLKFPEKTRLCFFNSYIYIN